MNVVIKDNDRWDGPQFYINDRSYRSDHVETALQSLRWKIYQNAVRRCLFQVLSDFFKFRSDRSDHMETCSRKDRSTFL